ncbi:MAG: orotidine-5'-phosphate decarboxylase [Chthoniobacterales bacterium]
MRSAADKLIIALDVATAEEAVAVVTKLRSQISYFKVGLQLYTAAGPQVVREILKLGGKVFLDLKLHDIPNTVAGAVASANKLGVDMLTIHLSGAEAMIRAATETAGEKLTIVGVTVLTSQSDETLSQTGVGDSVDKQVMRLASLGVKCRVGALVASAREAAMLRAEFRDQVKIITPGIRPAGVGSGDQKRVTTPRAAISAGADYLVIGRPVVADADPCAAVERILHDLSTA